MAPATPAAVAGLHDALEKAQENAATWHSEHPVQQAKLADLRRDLTRIAAELEGSSYGSKPWNRLWLWAEGTLSLEGQEALLAMMLEPHGDLIDDLAETTGADEAAAFTLDGSVRVAGNRPVCVVRLTLRQQSGPAPSGAVSPQAMFGEIPAHTAGYVVIGAGRVHQKMPGKPVDQGHKPGHRIADLCGGNRLPESIANV